jgi:hypothetical protein
MTLNPKVFALAAGLATAVLYAVCALVVAIAPGPSTAFVSYITHLDLAGLARPISGGGFLVGLLTFSVYAAIGFGLAAWFYNRLLDRRQPESAGTPVGAARYG